MNSETASPELSSRQPAGKFKKRSPLAAALLTLIVPGLGHFYSGEIKRGFVLYLIYIIYITAFYTLIKFLPQYLISVSLLYCLIPIGMYILIEAIIIAVNKKHYQLQFFNKSKYYLAIILTAVFFAGPIKDVFEPQAFSTPTGSMLNTILIGDKFLDNDMYYGIKNPFTGKYMIMYNNPQQGDVVSFNFRGSPGKAPENKKTNYLKRILGCPGDSLLIKKRLVYINGSYYKHAIHFKFDEDYSFLSKRPDPNIFPSGYPWNQDNYGPVIVPKAGETVEFDTSSIALWKNVIRDEGNELLIKKDRIFINDIEKYSYTFKNNYYFMIGDNWYNSLDSRFFGFVNENDIISKLTMIYFSFDSEIPPEDVTRRINSIRWDRIGKMIE